MAASKIPFILATLVGVHITWTAPGDPAFDHERKPELLRIGRLAPYGKFLLWGLLLAEVAAIVASNTPSPVSHEMLRILMIEHNADHLCNSFLSVMGALLSFCGGMVRLACYRHMGRHFTVDVSIRDHHKLITTGPYSVVRHPGYTGGLMNFLGIICYYAAEGSFLRVSGVTETVAGPILIVYLAVVMGVPTLSTPGRMRLEDGILRTHFGKEWEKWAEKVPYRFVLGLY